MNCIRCKKEGSEESIIRKFGINFWLCGDCYLEWQQTAFFDTRPALEAGDHHPYQKALQIVSDDLLSQIEKMPECRAHNCLFDGFRFNTAERRAVQKVLSWMFFMVVDPTPVVAMLNHLIEREFPTVEILGGDDDDEE